MLVVHNGFDVLARKTLTSVDPGCQSAEDGARLDQQLRHPAFTCRRQLTRQMLLPELHADPGQVVSPGHVNAQESAGASF